jgi:hypothetical protein
MKELGSLIDEICPSWHSVLRLNAITREMPRLIRLPRGAIESSGD